MTSFTVDNAIIFNNVLKFFVEYNLLGIHLLGTTLRHLQKPIICSLKRKKLCVPHTHVEKLLTKFDYEVFREFNTTY